MNPLKKLLTLFFYISVAVGSMSAQLYLTPDTSFAHAGDKAQVNIRVKNFNKLTGLQFSLNWNPAVLKYDTVSNFNLPGLSADMIGADPDTLASGKIALLWTSFQPLGNIMADGSTMLTFILDVVGLKGDSTAVVISDSPVFAEAYDSVGNEVPVIKGIGYVYVKPPLYVNEKYSEQGKYRLYNPDPNPFLQNTKISWVMPQSGNATIIVTDLNGNQVYQKYGHYYQGKNQLILNRKDFPAAGTYFVTLKSDNILLTRKLIRGN